MSNPIERGITYAVMGYADGFKNESVIDLSNHQEGCSVYPQGGVNPAETRKLIVMGLEVAAALNKTMFIIGTGTLLALGANQASEAIAQNNLPLAMETAKQFAPSILMLATPVAAIHYFQRRFRPDLTHKPGDLVPTKNDSYLRIIK